jgi:hypothetical protein
MYDLRMFPALIFQSVFLFSIETWGKMLQALGACTTTFLTFRNSRKPWPKVQKPLPKPLSSGFPGVGYTAVAFSNRQRFFTFQQRILAAVALHMKRQRLL